MTLIVFSLLFYAWGEPVYVFLMLGCVLVNYISGLLVDVAKRLRKLALAFGVACNLAILGTFKYAGFIAQTLCDFGVNVAVPKIALPIGISFYVFQSISYLVDVYRRESPVQRNFFNLLLYISMFPQLIAGPIVRYGTVAHEISNRKATAVDVADGIYRFLIGLGKKVIIANQLSELSDYFLANNLNGLSTLGSWVGIVAFTLQIYFDFSGYSDMAIGIGRCLGFHFKENFNHPYCCNSITDFWRRWHMSLGSFFRDYVYIPMGGNRSHQAFNILVVWFLTGMWHGASWNFIIWGLYFGIIVMLEKYTLLKVKDGIPSVLMHIYSLFIVVAGWGIFYFEDFNSLGVFFNAFFGGASELVDFTAVNALTKNFWLWIVAIVFCMPLRKWASLAMQRITFGNDAAYQVTSVLARVVISVVILSLSVALLVGATNNAFIYTRF
ncbi:MAG: MBOAT family O-acyltransferase [Muribaculaceae bacterium]